MAGASGEEISRILPQLRIDELLDELQLRLAAVRSSRDRVRQLLEAVVAIGSGLDLEQSLTRVVEAATVLVDARYGALGVLGEDGKLARFITVGVTEQQIAAIGPYPQGHGLLGELIRHPAPLRIEDLGAHPRSYGFPANHPPMHSFLGVPVNVRGEAFGNLYMTEKLGGQPFDADDEAVLIALAAAAGVAIDNARLYDEATRRQEWLETTAELARGLLSGGETADVLAGFAARVRRFARADLVTVVLPEPEEEDLYVAAADGAGAEQLRHSPVSLDDTLAGAVFKAGEAERLADLSADPREVGAVGDLDVGPALIVPLGSAGSARGVLCLLRRAGAAQFDQALLSLMTDLAAQAAVALELAHRRRESEQLSLYADRDRIGRDLHDLAIQRLFATSMSLQGAYKITEKPAVARRVAQAITDLDDTIKVIRSTIFALHANELDDEAPGVRARVVRVCEEASGPLGFPPAVRFTGPVDHIVGEDVADHLLAVLREALSNAARHAHASRVDVGLDATGTGVTLTVADDGVGIPAGGRRSGLDNLRQRAEQLGGRFAAVPGGTGGTVLTWAVPLIAAGSGKA